MEPESCTEQAVEMIKHLRLWLLTYLPSYIFLYEYYWQFYISDPLNANYILC